MDIGGRPTTDPAVALGGLIVLARGQKGSGLVVMTGLLSTLLTGAAYGTGLGNVEDGPNAGVGGQFVIVLNPAAFDTPGSWNTDGVVNEILKSRWAATWSCCRAAWSPI